MLKSKFEKFKEHRLDLDAEFVRSALGLPSGASAIVLNGQVYGPLDADEAFDVDDFTLLKQLARQQGVETIAAQIEEWKIDVSTGKASDVLMRSVAALGKYATREDRARQYVSVPGEAERWAICRSDWWRRQIRKKAESHYFSVVQLLATDPKRPVVDLVLVVDPLSKVTQKLSSIVASITRVVNCDLRLILNPKSKLSELPLKRFVCLQIERARAREENDLFSRFYRFALSEEPNFDQAGNTALPTVTFTDLPNKQLLTLTVVPPDAWMVQSTAANSDLDNIQMQHASWRRRRRHVAEDGRRGRIFQVKNDVNAKYELVHLLVS